MANVPISFISTTAAKENSLAFKEGQLIFVYDRGQLYLDLHGTRKPYSDFAILQTEAERTGMLAPITSFYYVKETKALWRYDDSGWSALAATPIPNETIDDIIRGVWVPPTT